MDNPPRAWGLPPFTSSKGSFTRDSARGKSGYSKTQPATNTPTAVDYLLGTTPSISTEKVSEF